jgi:hypothetical protein
MVWLTGIHMQGNYPVQILAPTSWSAWAWAASSRPP